MARRTREQRSAMDFVDQGGRDGLPAEFARVT
jgi:hypothetical protein